MKKLFLIFLITFVIDVRLKAKVIEVPRGCLKGAASCSVHVDKKSFEILPTQFGEMRMTKGSSATRVNENEYQLLRGLFLISVKDGPAKIKTLFAEFQLQSGAILLEVVDSKVSVTNLSSEMQYRPRGEAKSHKLTPGYATFFAGVTKVGVAMTGFPHPAEVEPLIVKWAKLFSKAEHDIFAAQFEKFLVSWRVVKDNVGIWYAETVQREISSQKAEAERLARLRAKQQEDDQFYRELFRRRVFE